MSLEADYASVLGRAREVPHDELPALLAALAAAQAVVASRLAQGRPFHDPGGTTRAEPTPWLTPEEAARIAGLPLGTPGDRERSVRRLYSWAKGQRWASRPSRKCLRIAEQPFRAWLVTRT